MFNSIRARLNATLIGLAIIPMLLVGSVLGYRAFQTQQQQAVASQEELGQRVATEIEAIIANLEIQLKVITDVRKIALLPAEEQQQLLRESRFFESAFDELTLLDAEGNVIVRSSRFNPSTSGNLATDDVFIRPVASGQTYYGDVQFDQNTGEPLITIAVPFYNSRTDELQGVLVANTRIKRVLDVINELDLGDGADVFIIDSQNRVIAHRDLSRVLNETIFEPPTENGTTTGLSGEQVILTTSTIDLGAQSLRVVTEESTAESLTAATNNALIVVGIMVAALGIAGLLGVAVVRQVVRPIDKLVTVAQAIEGGDLTQRAEVTEHEDEINTLAKTFNSMTSRLRQTVENLEQRVADRTRDLQLAVDMSQQISTQLNPDDLLNEMVQRTKSAFNYYGVHVYLLDEANAKLVQKAGAADYLNTDNLGWVEIKMDATPSLIAQAARTKNVVIANDVSQDTGYLHDEALPNTRSEMVVPIVHGDNMLGVLDLLSTEVNKFSENDVQVMKTLAGNVGVALANAQLFTEAQAAREVAEKANQIKSQFLANMSHELRTPLNAILNFTEFVADGVLGPVNDKQVETLQKAIASGDHLLSLINDILDLTKIEVGMMELFIEDVNLNTIIDSVLATTKGLVKSRPEVMIHSEIQEKLPKLQGDKRRLRQVLLNLISNAVKFTPKGEIIVSAQAEDNHIHVFVKDTGVGVSPEDQAVIFESFRQAEQGLTAGSGTGLGLPISKHFVEAHGGTMWLESALGTGSTFHFLLPLDAPPQATAENAAENPSTTT